MDDIELDFLDKKLGSKFFSKHKGMSLSVHINNIIHFINLVPVQVVYPVILIALS